MMCRPPAPAPASWRFCQSALIWALCSVGRRLRPAHAASTSSEPPSTMSVPRPAMLVAMVTAPGRPAWAMICASRSCCLALSTSCAMPALRAGAGQHARRFRSRWCRPAPAGRARAVLDVVDHRRVNLPSRLRNTRSECPCGPSAVGRDHHHFQAVDALEFVGFGVGRAGHAGQLVVHAEVVLEGDRGQRLVLALDRHAFLGLDRLVQAVGPATARQGAAGEFVDDDHLAVAHDVFDVALVQRVRAQAGVEVVHHAPGCARAYRLSSSAEDAGLAQQRLRRAPCPASVRCTCLLFSSTQ